jgi:hypothetical protein
VGFIAAFFGFLSIKNGAPKQRLFAVYPGDNGIRTHDTRVLYVDLANQCFKPLGHVSVKVVNTRRSKPAAAIDLVSVSKISMSAAGLLHVVQTVVVRSVLLVAVIEVVGDVCRWFAKARSERGVEANIAANLDI